MNIEEDRITEEHLAPVGYKFKVCWENGCMSNFRSFTKCKEWADANIAHPMDYEIFKYLSE